ncbi:MAG: hypothetical protein H6861_02265 [Rhodospirillales bacterium]|nr:hypothetical protein [Rhodospirillales bacterium]
MSYPRITMPSLIPAIIYLAGLIVMCVSVVLFFKNRRHAKRKAARALLGFLCPLFLFSCFVSYDYFHYAFVEKRPEHCAVERQQTETQNSNENNFSNVVKAMLTIECRPWERNNTINFAIWASLSLAILGLILSIHTGKLFKKEQP